MTTARRPVHRDLVLTISALLFLVCAAATIHWSRVMAAAMTMPGGWTLSMVWMPMPGQNRFATALGFQAMWVAMMGTMMIPSLATILPRNRWAGPVSAGYFAVWAVIGMAVYVAGTALAAAALQSAAVAQTVPIARGVVLFAVGWLQVSPWKSRHLTCYREGCRDVARAGPAGRRGIAMGIHCGLCCLPFMVILIAMGMMNLAVIALLALAITVERVVRAPALIARLAGLIVIGAGAWEIVRAV